MEKKQNAIIVVEGKTDTRKLETIFNNIKTIETN
jgi:5S rRNA maturation endonuclease (ribonuclease M5)